MRDIKFRAVYKGKVYKVTFIDFENKSVDIDVNGVKITTSLNNTPIIRFTGLKDENGKDIYEDDLINVDGDIYRVMFKEMKINWFGEGRYFINFWALQSVKDELDILPLENSFGTVVGNIYKNHELLEDK